VERCIYFFTAAAGGGGAAFARRLLRWFDLTMTISHDMRDALIEKGLEAEKCAAIRKWVDLKAIHPLPAYAANAFRGLPANKFVILDVGDIGRKQALQVVAEAESERDRMPQGATVLAPQLDPAALAETIRSAAGVGFGLPASRSRALAESLSEKRILANFEKAIFAADARGKTFPVRMDDPAAEARKGASG
jgi:hypothetical protein